MIHSLHKGTGFGGVLRYISNPDKGYLLGGSYRPEASTRDIAADMGSLAHDRTSKPVFHASLSLPPGERLDDAQWLRAASHYLEGLGYSDVPFVVYRHTDREHDHIHIVASRVTYDGKLVSDSNDRQRGMALCREIEKLYQLAAPTPRNAEATLRQEEIHGVKNKGEEHLKAKLRDAIQQSGQGNPTLSDFVTRLEQQGVGVTLNQTSKGTIRGISFEIEGTAFAGSSLGRDFSWAHLQRSYGLAQDQSVLRQPPAAQSAWSVEALDKLRSLLQETPSPAARRAAHALRAEGASALADVANASALALQATPQARFPAAEEAPFPTLRRALSLTDSIGDPRAALALADTLSGSPDPAQVASSRLLLRHFATAAAVDSPSPDVFFERLRGAGITLDPSRAEPELWIGHHSIPLDHLRGTLDAAYLAPAGHPDSRPPLPGSSRDRRDLAELLERLPLPPRPDHSAPGHDHAAALRPELAAGGDGPGGRPPGQDPAAQHAPDLASGSLDLPRGLPAHPRHADLPAPAMDAHAGPGPAAPPRPEHRAALSGDDRLPALAAPRSAGPDQHTIAQLEALGSERFDLRLRGPAGTQTLRDLTLSEVVSTLERLPAPAPGVLVLPAQESPVQFVGIVSVDAVRSAARRGFEPAILQAVSSAVSSDTFAVWVRHAPASPGQLPQLQTAARLAYGLSPEGRRRPFGPLGAGESLLRISAQPYRRAGHLAEALAASRRAVDKHVDAQLQAHRVPLLSPRERTPGPRKATRRDDRVWLQRALSQRVPPRALLHVLARDGSRAVASKAASARYALSALTSATPARALPAVARSLSLPTSYLQVLTKAVRFVRHFL
jgi:hypothetical protein